MRIKTILASVLVAGALVACGGKKSGGTTPAAGKSLYDRLGGQDAISSVVDDFVGNVAADERINARFKNANIENLKKQLKSQICAASGGPCKYTGKDMKTAHTGMNITDADFSALVEDLVKSLDAHHVHDAEKNDLLGALSKLHDDIVTAK